MNKLLKKILNRADKTGPKKMPLNKTIEQETNEVFERYQKSFKDLARYDRGEKISATN